MRKNGFTLVELLAIIIVIGILVTITGPFVINSINSSRKNAFKNSVEGIIRAIKEESNENNYMEMEYTIIDGTITDSNGNTLKTAGGSGENGSAIIDENGRVSIAIQSNDKKMCAKKLVKESSVKITDYDKDICKIEGIVTTKYEDGTAIYYNPNTNQKCTRGEAVSTTGTHSECMKWYTFLDKEGNSTVKMILDHNTSGNVAWSTIRSATSEMKEVKTRLEEDTAGWIPQARLITADELAEITGAKEALKWNSNKEYADTPTIGSTISLYYLDGKYGTNNTWQTQIANATNKSQYAWLYDQTHNCIVSGCNIEDNNKYPYGDSTNTDYIVGYWTSTHRINSYRAWLVTSGGRVANNATDHEIAYGVRPVITVSKYILSK